MNFASASHEITKTIITKLWSRYRESCEIYESIGLIAWNPPCLVTVCDNRPLHRTLWKQKPTQQCSIECCNPTETQGNQKQQPRTPPTLFQQHIPVQQDITPRERNTQTRRSLLLLWKNMTLLWRLLPKPGNYNKKWAFNHRRNGKRGGRERIGKCHHSYHTHE